jgi:hypothetical protein
MQSSTPPPSAQMMQMITGLWTSCCIYTAVKLDVADRLIEKPKTASQLAVETRTHEPSLYRLLRALSSIGIFFENENNEFELTSLGNTLRSDLPGSMRAIAIMNMEDHFGAWGNLLHSIKTGEIAFDDLHRTSIWGYYERNPQQGSNFNKAMAGMTQGIIMHLLPAYDFSVFKTIVDIGGGNGALLCGILKSALATRGIVYDSEEYIRDQAVRYINENHLQGRCSFEAGSFFDTVPPGASAYLMKSILHDWDDEHARKILANVQKAMGKGSKLLLIEAVVPERNIPHPGKLMDINMMVMTGGRERAAKEWKDLIEESGLNFPKIIPTGSPMFCILEAEKK